MFEKVCEILADKFDADASAMTMDTKVKEDLNADSLDVVELMMDVEELRRERFPTRKLLR